MSGRMRSRLVAGVGGALMLMAGTATTASAAGFAPVDQPGPPLTVPAARLAASLRCQGNVGHAVAEPVLLLPATTVDSAQNYSWNYERALTAAGIPYCTSDSVSDPYNMDDMQVRAQYVTYDIRRMFAISGRRIAVVGHSQGGMIMRWSLRFWPDTRAMVADVIGFAGTNHGSALIGPVFCLSACAPALRQQAAGSAFNVALNSGQETFPGISYTEIYSHTDEFVQPNLNSSGTSSVHGGGGGITDVALQDVCPLDVSEHLEIGAVDPVAWALALDAITHPGPAAPARIGAGVCSQTFMPGVNPALEPLNLANDSAQVAHELALAPRTSAEPPLDCYVTATCTGRSAPSLRPSIKPLRVRVGQLVPIHVLVRSDEGGAWSPVSGTTVRLGRVSAVTNENATAVLWVRLARRGHFTLSATRIGCNSGYASLVVTRRPRVG